MPAAFTKVTGQAHWEILLRARAIETQCYVWDSFSTLCKIFFFFLTITTAVAMHSVIKENNLHIKRGAC